MDFLKAVWHLIQDNSNGLSILLSLLGFAIVLLQLRKTRGAADAAKVASNQALQAMSNSDTISNLATIRERINKVQLALRGSRYEAALIEIQTLREGLYQLRSRRGFATDERKIDIQGMVTFLSKFQDYLERHLEDSKYEVPKRDMNNKLAEYATNLSEWMERMRFISGGDINDPK
jgi:hypothetical protein